jgi:hypothetical protein
MAIHERGMAMAEKKTPQDHKAKQDDAEDGVLVIEGVKVVLDPSINDDMDFIEDSLIAQDEKSSDVERGAASFRAMRRMFGDQFNELKDKARGEGGHPSMKKFGEFFQQAMEASNPNS